MTRRPALLVVAVLVIAACGSAQPSSPPAGSASPGEACPLTTQPGQADEPDRGGGDAIDMSDYGGGRWRLCLTEPTAATAERTAWCIWARDRKAVSEVDGLQVSIGARDYDASISIGRNAFDFGTIDHASGRVASYQPSEIPHGDASPDGSAGWLAFAVVLMVDPEGGAPAPDDEPHYAGLMRWQCGDPPPPG